MKRNFYLILFITVLSSSFSSAQITTKLDLRLWKRLHDGDTRKVNMPLLVKGDMNAIEKLTAKFGGVYKYGYNDISSIEIPEMNLIAFANEKAVEKIENTGAKGVFLMDTARVKNNIDSVHGGFAPLPNNLKGRNVVVGIIDGGIYFQHYDFRNTADSTTRVRYIWDQVTSGANPPAPFGYGNQWDSADINAGNCTHVPPLGDNGHGTCVAGIAAGNSLSTKGTAYENQFTGVAPEADIIAVRIKNDNNFLTNVADAVNYIFTKATALGKPCVINTSIGTYYGSHDGIDLATQLIEAQLDQQSGRVLVAAAGNTGDRPYHLGYDIPVDSAYTYITYNPSLGYHYFDFWTDTANFNNALFKVGAYDNNGNFINSTEYFSVPADFNPPQGSYTVVSRFLANNSLTDEVYIAVSLVGTRYQVEFQIYPSNNANYWRLQTSGTGRIDGWISSAVIGSSDMTSYLNGGIYITDPHYRHPDTLQTMVTSWQNSDKVITVGNYSNRAGYTDYNSSYVDLTASPYNEIVGKKVHDSSVGPTRDNRLKPDIVATGNTTIATGDANYISALLGSGQGYKVSVTGKQVRNGGTSMASPIVAGIAALYLEQRQNATYAEVKQALICSATKDIFTGTVANVEYGNGKVNAFAALTSSACISYGSPDTACLNYNPTADFDTGCVAKVYGCTDTGSFNYNPLANIEDGSCIAKIYGCTDTASTNYDALANTDNGTCIPKVYGCTDTGSINYNALANIEDGSCVPKIYGCTDTASTNYDALANTNDGSCIPKVYGCTDTGSINYNSLANVEDGSCNAKIYGCTDTASTNYDVLANTNDGSCTPKVYGCTDTGSANYNSLANIEDGSCIAKIYGCTDTASTNYDALANTDDGSCIAKVYGCTDTSSINYNSLANVEDGSCVPKVYGCTDTGSINFNFLANIEDGSCVAKIYGCTDTASTNYDALANTDNGSCAPKIYGCTDTGSINYNSLANVEDGSCVAKIYGCTDTASINYDALANTSNGSCILKIYGCTDTGSINYSPVANVANGSCIAKVYGCIDTGSLNYNSLANVSDGSCVPKIYGATDTACLNYNSLANIDNNSCIPKVYGITDTACVNYNALANVVNGVCIQKVYGCTDSTATNYNPQATIDDGTCITSSIGSISAQKISVQIIPNPFSEQTTFKISGLIFEIGSIRIYNVLGEVIDEILLAKNKTEYIYTNNSISKGVYFYCLSADERNFKTGKLVIE